MCESTCFSEPVVIYTKGNVINLYQVILDKRLNFKYVAMDTSYLDVKATEEGEYFVTLSQDSIESFFLWPQRDSPGLRTKLGASKSPQPIELMSISRDECLELFDLYPESAQKLKEYSVQQLEHVSEVRAKKEHLHMGNYKSHYYRKEQILMEQRADVNSDMKLEVAQMNTDDMLQQKIEDIVIRLNDEVEALSDEIKVGYQRLLYKIASRKKRNVKQTRTSENQIKESEDGSVSSNGLQPKKKMSYEISL